MANTYYRYPSFTDLYSLTIHGSTSGAVTLTVPAVVTSYTLTLPAAQGASGTTLQNDGAGNLSWVSASSLLSVGTFDGQAPAANGLVISGSSIYAQSASVSVPGMVNTGAQSFSGDKDFGNSVTVGHRLGVGGTPIASSGLYILGSPTTGSVQYGVRSDVVFAAAATGVYSFLSNPTTGPGTTPLVIHYGTTGAGGTYQRQLSFYAPASTAGSVGSVALSDNLTFTGNWFINQSGTAASTLGGALSVADLTVNGAATVSSRVGIGGSTASAVGVYLQGTVTSGSTQYGFDANNTFAAVGTDAFAFTSAAQLANGASYTSATGYYAGNVNKIGTAAVTNQYGFLVADLSSGDNNYGIRSTLSNTANKWNLYIDGLAPNYIAGNLAVGATSPDPFSRGYDRMFGVSTGSGQAAVSINSASGGSAFLDLGVNNTRIGSIEAYSGAFSFNTIGSGTNLVLGASGVAAFAILGSGSGSRLKNFVSANEITGAGVPMPGSNCPAVDPSTPYKWLAIVLSDNSVVYIPCYK